MRGFIGLTAKEKEDILKKHTQPYDGYATMGNNTNMYPLTTYNDAKDTQGITLDNKNNPSSYRNHRINEIAAKNLHYDEIDPAYEFDSKGPGDPNLGYDVYNQTKNAYDFDSKGPVDPFYGGGYQTGFEDHGEDSDDDYKFDMVDFEDYIEGGEKTNIEESVNKTINMFKRFKKYN
jgi:hypothetical protein